MSYNTYDFECPHCWGVGGEWVRPQLGPEFFEECYYCEGVGFLEKEIKVTPDPKPNCLDLGIF